MENFYKEKEMLEAELESGVIPEDYEPVKEKKPKKSKLPVFIAGGAVAIVFAIVAYWLLISAEDALLSKYDKTTVYVLNTDIVRGTQLDDPSVFSEREVAENAVPSNAVTSLSDLKNTYAVCDLKKNTIVTDTIFYSVDEAENGTKEISFSVDDLAGSVNGAIRTSDYIDMYILNIGDNEDEDDEYVVAATPKYTHVYVSAVYTSDGLKIENGDTTSIASRFTIVVPDKDADYIIGAFASDCTIYVTRWTDRALDAYED